METCENCGKVIGLKETPYLYKTRVVCEPCHKKIVKGKYSAIDGGIACLIIGTFIGILHPIACMIAVLFFIPAAILGVIGIIQKHILAGSVVFLLSISIPAACIFVGQKIEDSGQGSTFTVFGVPTLLSVTMFVSGIVALAKGRVILGIIVIVVALTMYGCFMVFGMKSIMEYGIR
jgi:hypothetical protein